MAGGWDDERAPGPPPHRDDRLWVHPSELRAAAAPPPARRRRLRLPVGTALVAGATGALAMFTWVTALGLPSETATSAPPSTIRTEVAAAYLTTAERDSTVEVELADGRRLAGLVIDDEGHLVVAASLDTAAPVRVATTRVRDVRATVVARAGSALSVLLAPGLRWTERVGDATEVLPGRRVTALRRGGDPFGTAMVLSRRWDGGCASLAESPADLGGRLVVDGAGRAAGLVALDADRSDRVVFVVPATVALAEADRALAGVASTCP